MYVCMYVDVTRISQACAKLAHQQQQWPRRPWLQRYGGRGRRPRRGLGRLCGKLKTNTVLYEKGLTHSQSPAKCKIDLFHIHDVSVLGSPRLLDGVLDRTKYLLSVCR